MVVIVLRFPYSVRCWAKRKYPDRKRENVNTFAMFPTRTHKSPARSTDARNVVYVANVNASPFVWSRVEGENPADVVKRGHAVAYNARKNKETHALSLAEQVESEATARAFIPRAVLNDATRAFIDYNGAHE